MPFRTHLSEGWNDVGVEFWEESTKVEAGTEFCSVENTEN